MQLGAALKPRQVRSSIWLGKKVAVQRYNMYSFYTQQKTSHFQNTTLAVCYKDGFREYVSKHEQCGNIRILSFKKTIAKPNLRPNDASESLHPMG